MGLVRVRAKDHLEVPPQLRGERRKVPVPHFRAALERIGPHRQQDPQATGLTPDELQ